MRQKIRRTSDDNYLAPLQTPPQTAQQQLQLRHIGLRQEQERLRRLRLEEERLRQEQRQALDRQRRELLQLQLQQHQQEHRLRRQILQRQLEVQQQQRHKAPPSPALCTIYEAMETSDDDTEGESRGNEESDVPLRVANGNLRRAHAQDWNAKLDAVQQLIHQALLLTGEDCPPLLYLPGQGGGVLSPLESRLWPRIISCFNSSSAAVASVSSYSPIGHGSSTQGDWTVVELETYH